MSYPNDCRFPDDSEVLVKYPLPMSADRESWPWLHGVIVDQVGYNEWQVLVDDDRVAENDAELGENTYPLCWRDASELRRRPRRPGTSP